MKMIQLDQTSDTICMSWWQRIIITKAHAFLHTSLHGMQGCRKQLESEEAMVSDESQYRFRYISNSYQRQQLMLGVWGIPPEF